MKTSSVIPRPFFALLLLAAAVPLAAVPAPAKKIRDLVIYADTQFHNAFPSVVRRPDGELLVAFRRAPNRLAFGEAKNNHVDPNSQLVAVRSRDAGATWSTAPALIYADPLGGSQDPCLLQLRDDTLLCFTYGWSFLRPDGVAALKAPFLQNFPGSIFNGGSYLRSADGGRNWSVPVYPPHLASEVLLDAYGRPVPAYNRGALTEGRDGRLFWAVAATDTVTPRKTSVHLLISSDHGASWTPGPVIAADPKVSFNETSIYETPKGDLVAFLRSESYADQACIARSIDGGKTFLAYQSLGFQGHPLHALRLPDDRVLLTYGYRHAPLGVRARILNPECTDSATAPEIILRDDGGTRDLGYPWSVQLDAQHVLVTYYFNSAAQPIPHIAGTVLEIP
ncbi:MAG: exo-alpha-sialidase [Undibacterium sp.]|nr:exo-alpha-sialidase [Opitutaceae bacterium]